MTNVTIFCSSIPEREHLLNRSISSWVDSGNASNAFFSIAVYKEGMPEEKHEVPFGKLPVVEHWSTKRTGSPEVGSNFLWDMHKWHTDVAIFTHPEIMFGIDVVKQAVEFSKDKTYVTFRPFWIPRYLTDHWDEYHFQNIEDCESCDEMYQYGPDPNGATRYLNLSIRDNKDWQSDTTWAGNKSTISEIFPVPQFGVWGPIDGYLAGCRRGLGHKTVVPDACVYHQDHPRIEGREPGYAVRVASDELIKKFGHMV